MGMVLRLQLSGFTIACGVLTLYTAAYCAEIVRGAIGAVPATTRRAALHPQRRRSRTEMATR